MPEIVACSRYRGLRQWVSIQWVSILCGVICVGLSHSGLALGLGDISHASRLGEPLQATIGVITGGEFFTSGEVKARQVSQGEAKALGFDIGYSPYRFDFISEGEGRDLVIRVVSHEKITEPYLNIVVELQWSGGIVYREYTFFLDPAGVASR